MKNNFKLFCAVLLFLSCFNPEAALAEKDDLLSLYHLAIARDSSVGRSRAQLEASKADIDIAFSLFLPHADVSASVTRFYNTTLNYYATGDEEGKYTGHAYGVGARMPIFQLPYVYNLKAAQAATRSADASLNGSSQELVTRLADGYFGLLKAQANEELYRDELKRLSRILEQSQAFLKAGTGDVIAVYEARARMDAAAADLVKAESQRKVAEQILAALVGRPVLAVHDLREYEPRGPEPNDLQWWLDTMNKNQPEIIAARESLSQTEQQRMAVKAQHLPTLQAQAGYNVSKGSTFLPEVETRQYYFGLSLTLPLYAGGETAARTRKMVASEMEQRFILEHAVDQRTQSMKEAFLNLNYSIAIFDSMRQKRASSELQLTAISKGRTIGTRTAVDLMNAEQGYAVSRRDLSEALYENAKRQLQLKAAAGILSENDLIALNNHLIAHTQQEPATAH